MRIVRPHAARPATEWRHRGSLGWGRQKLRLGTRYVERTSETAKFETARTPIRRPVAEVFEAFIDPDITTQFWFTKSSGRLEPGKRVEWAWEMYDIAISVTPKVIEPNKRIVIEWPGYGGLTTVQWTFRPMPDATTFVSITESGFTGSGMSS